MVTTSNDLGKNGKDEDETSPLSLSSTSTTLSTAHVFKRKVKNGNKVSRKKLHDKNKYSQNGANLSRNKTRELNENIDKVYEINEKSQTGKNTRKIDHNKKSEQNKNISKRNVNTDVNCESLQKETNALDRSDCRNYGNSATRCGAKQISNRPHFEHDRRNTSKKITEIGSKINVKNFTLECLTTESTKPEKSEVFKSINTRINGTKEAKNINKNEGKKDKRRTIPASTDQKSIPESSSTTKNAHSYSITTSGTISKSSLPRNADSVAENINKSNFTNKARIHVAEAKDLKTSTTADTNNPNLLNGKKTKINLTELVGTERQTNKNLKLYEQQYEKNVSGANFNKSNFGFKDLKKYFTKDKEKSSAETKDQKEKSTKNSDKKKNSAETKDKKVENGDKGKEFLSIILDPAFSNKNSKFSDSRIKRLFLRKVFMVYAISWSATLVIAFFIRHLDFLQDMAALNSLLWFLPFVLWVALLAILFFLESLRRNPTTNLVSLAALTLCSGTFYGCFSCYYRTSFFILFLFICSLVFGLFACFQLQNKVDFNMLSGFGVMAFTTSMCVTCFVFCGSNLTSIVFAALFSVMWISFVMFDIYLATSGWHAYSLDPEEYVFMSLSIIYDVYYIGRAIVKRKK